jgi:NDP-sugar pyrophosphorylase family protein
MDMDALILRMLADGRPVAKYALREYWLDIGQIPDYEKAQDVYETMFRDDQPE